LKSCLLAPAEEPLLRNLAPLATVASSFVAGPQPESSLAAWQVVALGLYEYRRGNFSAAVDWTQKYSTFNNYNASRSALAHCVLAMTYHQLSESGLANAEVTRARELIEPRFNRPLEIGDWNQGYWYDWLIARVLLREASGLIDPR
jgi:hypothetical protein